MASTYSQLKIELIATGEQSGTWGATTNTNLGTALEEAITGTVDVPFSSADVTLTLTNTNASQTARNLRLNLTGTSGGARNLIVPAIEKFYIINNALANDVTVKNSSGTGTVIKAGTSGFVFNNGTSVVSALNYYTGSADITGGTINGVIIGGSSAAAITGTAITGTSFNGGSFSGTNGTFTSLSDSGNLAFTGTANRITGDFSNATFSNRVAFQTTTADSNTVVGVIPNGTATGSSYQVYNNSTLTNASLASLEASSTSINLASSIRGAGTYLPLYFYTNNTLNAQLSTAGVFSVTGSISSTRINPRSLSLASTSGAITPTSDSFDQVNYSLTGSSSFSNPSGTPVNGQKLTIRIYAASLQTISSWSSSSGGYRAIGVSLPTSAQADKTVYVGCVWNSTDSFWDVVAVATQA